MILGACGGEFPPPGFCPEFLPEFSPSAIGIAPGSFLVVWGHLLGSCRTRFWALRVIHSPGPLAVLSPRPAEIHKHVLSLPPPEGAPGHHPFKMHFGGVHVYETT